MGPGRATCPFDAHGRHLLTANYASGTVAVFPVLPDGSLRVISGYDQQQGSGVNRDRQEGPHAHSIYVDSSNRFVYSCDLGNDRVEGYRFDATKGTITRDAVATTAIAPGSGPRHLVLAPSGFVYVINEMASTVTALRRNESTGCDAHAANGLDLAAGIHGLQHLRGNRAASEWEISLRLESRPRQHHGLCRCGRWPPHADRIHEDRRNHAAQFRARPERPLVARRESEERRYLCFPGEWPYRQAHRDRTEGAPRRSGLRGVPCRRSKPNVIFTALFRLGDGCGRPRRQQTRLAPIATMEIYLAVPDRIVRQAPPKM